MPSIRKRSENFYEEEYSKIYHSTISISANIAIQLVGKGKNVLDVGCGDGTIAKLLQDAGNQVIGVDISESFVESTKIKGIESYTADLEEGLPFPQNSFDVVFFAEVIEHIFDTDRFLEEVKKVLRPNGVLILTTPNLAALGRRFLLFFGKNPIIETSLRTLIGFKGEPSGHIRYFVKESLFRLLEFNGFKIDYFTSDVINFTGSGKYSSIKLAKLFPTFGRGLIVKAIKCCGAIS